MAGVSEPRVFGGKDEDFGTMQGTEKILETVWRWTQAGANHSPPRFPANREKYGEFCSFFGLESPCQACKPLNQWHLVLEISILSAIGTGNFQGSMQGINRGRSGNNRELCESAIMLREAY
jgi:hypothetical protein